MAAMLLVPVKRAAYTDKRHQNGGFIVIMSFHPALAERSSLKMNDYS